MLNRVLGTPLEVSIENPVKKFNSFLRYRYDDERAACRRPSAILLGEEEKASVVYILLPGWPLTRKMP